MNKRARSGPGIPGVRSTQRLAVADAGVGVIVGMWPAELKPQALYLYTAGRSAALIAAARKRGWSVNPIPQLAFWNASASQRLYLDPEVSADDYARRWEELDRDWIGQYSAEEVRSTLWPWLKQRSYASSTDDKALNRFLSVQLGRRPAHLRPALRLWRTWDADAIRALRSDRNLAAAIRRDIDGILGAAGEPELP